MASAFQAPPAFRATIVRPLSPKATMGCPAADTLMAVSAAGRLDSPVAFATVSIFHDPPEWLAAFTMEPSTNETHDTPSGPTAADTPRAWPDVTL